MEKKKLNLNKMALAELTNFGDGDIKNGKWKITMYKERRYSVTNFPEITVKDVHFEKTKKGIIKYFDELYEDAKEVAKCPYSAINMKDKYSFILFSAYPLGYEEFKIEKVKVRNKRS